MNKTVQLSDKVRIHDAANYLGVSTKTLRRWGKKGKLVAERSVGNQRFYSKEQLESFALRNNFTETESETLVPTINTPLITNQTTESRKSHQTVTKWLLATSLMFLVVIGLKDTVAKKIDSTLFQKAVESSPSVLAVSTGITGEIDQKYTFAVNVPAQFNETVDFDKNITAPNVVYSVNGKTGNVDVELTAGNGITLDGLTITNSGITSLAAGDGISVSGNTITNSGITSLTAGGGISVSGSTITNNDKGSTQLIFKTISVSGEDDIIASSNSDTLAIGAGTGIVLTTDPLTNTLTITNSANPDYTLSGWTDNGSSISLTTPTDTVSIASILTSSGINNQNAGITNAGSITGATGLTSSGQITFGAFSTGILHSNISGVISSSAINLASSDITGTLATTSGGTGLTSYVTGDIPYASNTNVLSKLGIGSAGQVLVVAGGIPTWGTISGGSGGVCTNCLVSDPGSTQTITPTSTSATGLIVRQASSGSVDIFKITDNTGTNNYLSVDHDGNIIFGNGTISQLNTGIFTVNPANSDPLTISPVAMGSGAFTGTITSEDLTQNRTWTFPDLSGIVCTTAGNCTGTSSSLGGSGTANYISKWQGTYSLANSLIYDDGTYVGIGTANPNYKLDVNGTGNISGATTLGSTLGVTGATTLSSTLGVTGATTLSSTLGVTGATTLSSTLGVTGNTTVGGNLMINGAGIHYFSAGSLGIGTTTPTAKLDIAGIIETDAFRISNSGSKVLGLSYGTNSIGMDLLTSDLTNKITNGTFESDLTSWTSVPSYTLNDQFTTDKTPAELDADTTTAEPTGGVRTVTDTNDKLSITGGQLSVATGGNAAVDPRITYPSISRSAGKILVGDITTNLGAYFGIGSNTAGGNLEGFRLTNNVIQAYQAGSTSTLGSIVAGTAYKYAIIQRATGLYYFIKGGTFTNWTLLYYRSDGSTSTLYPLLGINDVTDVITADNIRIPTSTWLPTPLAYDTFTRADGAIGNSETTGPDSQATPSLAWTGGAISSNKNVITPSLGSDLWDADAAAFTSGTYGWTAYGTNGMANVSNTLQITWVDNEYGARENLRNSVDLSNDLTVGGWYQFSTDAKINTGSATLGGTDSVSTTVTETSFTTKTKTWKASSTTNTYLYFGGLGAGEIITLDNLSLKPLTLPSLFSTVSTSDADVIADANVTLTTGTQAGLVLNLDSTSSPDDFIVVYSDGTNIKVEEAVNGVYTAKQSTAHSGALAYVAGATLRAIREGTKLRVYYNNALVGAELTMTANTNTKHGLFSTYSGNSFDNFTLWPRGSGTTKFTSAPFEELTATRVTSPTYGNSTGSVQLVTSGTDSNYTQSVNVGDTSSYTLTAYAYTNGSAVTSSDLSLYYDTATITTNYSAMGSGGWYKLTGTVTGVASSKDYGVRVKAGKTVYLDSFTVSAGTGSASTLYIANSGTGTAKLSVQDTTTLNAGSLSSQGLIVKGYGSTQTANLQEWQTSGGVVLGSVSNSGLATFNSVSAGSLIGTVSSGGEGIKITSGGSSKMAFRYVTDGSVSLDIPTTTTSNKFTNSSFDSGITGWDYGYTLNDQFTTDKTPAELDADTTTAEPTGGVRTVTDTNDKLSITGGQLSFATGGVGLGDPGIWYPAITGAKGKVLVGSVNTTSTTRTYFGFDTNQSGAINGSSPTFYWNSATSISVYDGIVAPVIATLTAATNYQHAVVLGSTGAYFYMKGGTEYPNWTFLYSMRFNNVTGNIYPALVGANAIVTTADNISIPTSTWLPTPLAYDDFASADMTTKGTGPDDQTTPQLAWTGGSDAGGVMTITPAETEKIVNGSFDTDTSWTKGAGWTIDTADSNVAEGIATTNYLYQAVLAPGWYKHTFDVVVTGGSVRPYVGGMGTIRSASGSYTEYLRTTDAGTNLWAGVKGHSAFTGTIDNVSVKELTLSSLFSTVSTSDADVIADVTVSALTSGTQAGLVLNLDSMSSPSNFIIVYHDGTNLKVDEAVAGVYTNKQSTAVALGAGALRVTRDGTKLRAYLNNALVGSELTMTANTNTKHGLFSTYSGNTFDNFTLWARGTGNEYVDLPDTSLTATAETGITYGASSGSTKLVAGSSGSSYTQSINVGDTSAYTLSAAVYTTGSAVTSSDLQMTAGGDLLSTTFTSLGAGWYRASATVTGVASAKNYGVFVHSGKTVYVDNLNLIASSGLASIFNVQNTLTGLGQMNVESTTTLNSGSASLQALIVKGATSQTEDLAEWQNSSGSVLASVSSSGLVNATVGGVATLVKAGVISDSDFTNPVDGLVGIDTTNHRIYFREGGTWSYTARTEGFQIPKEEVLGLSAGDFLLPYVDTFMSDGAVHGLWQKFDMNKLLQSQDAIVFEKTPKFPSNMGGTVGITTGENEAEVIFDEQFVFTPVVNVSPVWDIDQATLDTMKQLGTYVLPNQDYIITNITNRGFEIILEQPATVDLKFNWSAILVSLSETDEATQSAEINSAP